MPEFIPGLELAERFYRAAVQPIITRHYPGLRYSAALIGHGSEVLGYDTPLSTDHHWGPRLQLFLAEEDLRAIRPALHETLRQELPTAFLGYSTHFGPSDDIGVRLLREIESGPVDHRVEITTVVRLVEDILGVDVHQKVTLEEWLTFPEQELLGLTRGRVFHDGLGELTEMQAKLAYHPHDVWLYLMAAQWARIGQQEAFVGRCGDVGDELGSRLVAAALVRDLMRLCFLLERTYSPYSKWFGTAFARLRCAPELLPVLESVTSSVSWKEREQHLCSAYQAVARMHNRLAITEALPVDVRLYYERPYRVISAERFVTAIRKQIRDEQVRRLPPNVGSVDQFVDSTDVVMQPDLRSRLRALYGK
jgi:hypothetical protein